MASTIPGLPESFLEASLTGFYRLRQQGYEKPPATAELLDWLGSLQAGELQAPGTDKDLPHIGTLLKRTEDLLKFKGTAKIGRF